MSIKHIPSATSINEPTTTPIVSEMDTMLTAEEVSTTFFSGHISYWSVLSMAKNNELPCIWHGRRPYFFLSSLLRWKAEQENLPKWAQSSRRKSRRIGQKNAKGGAA